MMVEHAGDFIHSFSVNALSRLFISHAEEALLQSATNEPYVNSIKANIAKLQAGYSYVPWCVASYGDLFDKSILPTLKPAGCATTKELIEKYLRQESHVELLDTSLPGIMVDISVISIDEEVGPYLSLDVHVMEQS